VDAYSPEDNLLSVKTVINQQNPSEREFNLGSSIKKHVELVIYKIGTVHKFNKQYLAI